MTCMYHTYYDKKWWGITGITQNDVVFLVRYDKHIAVPKVELDEKNQKHIDYVKKRIAAHGAKWLFF